MNPPQLSPGAERLLAAARAAPGLPLRELRERTGLGWSTLYHELGVLEDAGLLRSKKKGRHVLVFPADAVPPAKAFRHVVLLQGATAREITARIAKRPGKENLETLAERLDRDPRTVYYHLRRLLDAKLITSSSTTRYRDLVPTPPLADALAAAARRPKSGGKKST